MPTRAQAMPKARNLKSSA